MKKTLLILSILSFWGCRQDQKVQEEYDDQDTREKIFFSSDSTVFLTLQHSDKQTRRDSILKHHGFEKKEDHWSYDRLAYYQLSEHSYKVVVEDEQYVDVIQQSMEKLSAFQQNNDFWFGILLYRGKPLSEVFFIKKDQTWILKVFPRYRL